MEKLNVPLENGLIPLVEIAKILYPYWNEPSEPDFVDFNMPEFDNNGRMFVSFCGEKNGCGFCDYLFFENNQFKILSCDSYWTSDNYLERIRAVEFDQIILLK